MTARSPGAAAVLAMAALSATGCRRGQDAAGTPDAMASAASSTSAEAGATPHPTVLEARCHPVGPGASVAAPEDLELGDAIPLGDGFAVGLVHRTAAGRLRAVALLDKEVTSTRVVDLGPTLGDAPPPHLTRRGDEVLVAGYALPTGELRERRELSMAAVSADGTVKPLPSVMQQRDDSLAFDLAPPLVVWGEATGGATPRGVIRAQGVPADAAHPARDVSPPESDAEMPRIVADGAGYFVLWLARRPEPGGALDAGPAAAAEATGEARAYSWLESVRVDGAGTATGPVRRLTPASGHVSAYDVQALGSDGRASVLVVARDDGEAVDGSGGVLLRVRLRDDGAEPPLAFPGDGLGRGAPSLVEGTPPWLAWIGPHEGLRLLPLDAAGAPLAPPSAEPALDEALPLLVTSGATAEETRMLVAFPAERGAGAGVLRLFACAR